MIDVRHAKGSRVTGSHRDKMAVHVKSKYDGGESIRAIAAEEGRSYGFVHSLLGEAGAVFRRRGGAERPAHRRG